MTFKKVKGLHVSGFLVSDIQVVTVPWKRRELESEHFSRPLVVVDGAAEDEHLIANNGSCVE